MKLRILPAVVLVLIFCSTGAFAAPVQWAAADGGNDHWYEIIRDTTIPYKTWTEARHDAEAMTFNGMQGHLATLTSQAENDFVGNAGFLGASYNHLYGDNVWIGGYQYDNHDEPAGHWAWVTGEAWNWTSWAVNEPNGGDYLRFGANNWDVGKWFDQTNTPSPGVNGVAAFIVEYQAAPVPAAVWLLGSGLVGLFGLRGKIKRAQ